MGRTQERAQELLHLSQKELYEELRGGHPIDPAELDDTEYRGVSLGLPGWLEKLTWKKFMKTFHRCPETSALRGWNVRIVQTPLSEPSWEPQRKHGSVVHFGHYQIVSPENSTRPYAMPGPRISQGLMIDYSLANNHPLDPVNLGRDPLVALNRGSAELLLGWTYLDFGVMRAKTPSFFSLVRQGPLSHLAWPRRKATELTRGLRGGS